MSKVVLGVARHILTALGGSLVAAGWLPGTDLDTAIGAIVTLIGIAWSAYEKRQLA